MEPKRYEVNLIDRSMGCVWEKVILRSTLQGIEAFIMSKFPGSEITKIQQITQPDGVYDLTENIMNEKIENMRASLKRWEKEEGLRREEIKKLNQRISDLEELLTQYDPDRDESHLDDNQR